MPLLSRHKSVHYPNSWLLGGSRKTTDIHILFNTKLLLYDKNPVIRQKYLDFFV